MYRVTIDFQYTNATGAAVYLPTCRSTYPPVLEKRVGSQWVRAYSGPVLVCSGAPQRVAAGATASSTLEVEAGLPGSGLGTQFETTTIEGTYRLVWAIYAGGAVTSSDLDGLMPLEQRISNEFTLSR